MVKVCDKVIECQKTRFKRGFGIVEVLIAAAVLGFRYTALLNLQSGNRDALLRIRGRDGATEVAQSLIDSLGALGVASLTDEKLIEYPSGTGTYMLAKKNKSAPDTVVVERKWTGQPGLVEHTMSVQYRAVVTVSQDEAYMAKTSSLLLGVDSVKHVYAKRLDVKVSWCFKCVDPKNPNQSITVSGVIR